MFLRFVLAFVLIGGSAFAQQTIHKSYDSAASESSKTGKPMLILVKGVGCAPCKKLQTVIEQMIGEGELKSQTICYLDMEENIGDVEKLTDKKSIPQLHWYPKPGAKGRFVIGFVSRSKVLELIRGTK